MTELKFETKEKSKNNKRLIAAHLQEIDHEHIRDISPVTGSKQMNKKPHKLHFFLPEFYKSSFLFSLFVVFLFLFGTNNNLMAQNNIFSSSGNYSFFADPNTSTFNNQSSSKSYTFFSGFNKWSRKKKAIAINVATLTATATIGAVSWDYYSSSFHFRNEGWLDKDTVYGGSDKFGHAFAGYALTSVYHSIYKGIGYSNDDAITLGAISSWSLMTLIEAGDGFSKDYGFSIQDETFNTAGVFLGYIRNKYPELKDMFDYRLEWWPSNYYKQGKSDPFTDYSGQKNLLIFKPAGILHSDNELLKAINLDFGFYTRGYEDNLHTEKRYLFYGVGLDVTYILKELTGHNFYNIFNYLQVPFTYIAFTSEIH